MTKKNIQIEKELSLDDIHKNENTLKNEIALCDSFLDLFAENFHKWSQQTSYHYKHLVESYFGTYISNDAFIHSARQRFESKPANDNQKNYLFKFKLKNPKQNCRPKK